MPARENDPVGNYNFIIEIGGVTTGAFAEMSGFDLETEVIEYRNGNEFNTRKLPGLHKVNDITLKRGIIGSNELWDWYKAVLNGQVDRRSVSIILLDEARQETVRWNLFEAWPRRYVGPHLNASGNEVAMEELTLVAERLELAT